MLITRSRLILAGRYAQQCTRLYSAAAASRGFKGPDAQGELIGVPSSAPKAELPSTDEPKVAAHIEQLVEQIASLNLIDVVDLNRLLKKRLKLPDAPMMPSGMVMAAAAPAPAIEEPKNEAPKKEKKDFTVKLVAFNAEKKVDLIKEVRKVMKDMNLVQAKKFIESAPVDLKVDVPKKEAEQLKADMEKLGATVELV